MYFEQDTALTKAFTYRTIKSMPYANDIQIIKICRVITLSIIQKYHSGNYFLVTTVLWISLSQTL